jgi:orotidine-5'-phosphate decarboxylase
MYFIEKLIQTIRDKKSVVCMGLDPRLDESGQIPKSLIDELNEPNKIILEFNKTLIDFAYDLIPIIKPQIAFYEKYEAFNALKETINYAHKKDMLVLLDSKRNDIGPTSEAYAYSTFKNFNADACTVNGYFGIDGIKPFLEYQDKGTFIIVKTSNPSSEEFQNLFSTQIPNIPNTETQYKANSIILERNYVQMAKLVYNWGLSLKKFSTFSNLGVVVGATYPNELKKVREIVKNSYILIPGYGAQGAQVKDIKYGFNENGLGAIVNSSRNIIYAYHIQKKPPEKFAEAAREEIIDMNQKINKEIRIKE